MWTYCGVWNCSFCLYPRWSWSCIKFVHISYKKVSRNVRVSRLMAWEIGVRQLLLHMWQPFGNMQSGIHIGLSVPASLCHTIRVATGPYSFQKLQIDIAKLKRISRLFFYVAIFFNFSFTLCKCWSIHLRHPTWYYEPHRWSNFHYYEAIYPTPLLS